MHEIDQNRDSNDDIPTEIRFDYSKAKPNRFVERLSDDQVVVALDPDVAAIFGDAESVNRVLRALIETMPSIPADPA